MKPIFVVTPRAQSHAPALIGSGPLRQVPWHVGWRLPCESDDDASPEPRPGRIDIEAAARKPEAFAAFAATQGGYRARLHRMLDVTLAGALVAFTAPLMLATILAIRLEGPGPVIFRQERVGLGGRVFTLLKFRSMRVDAERDGPAWAAKGDARITRVGRFIRRSRIDELPQLFNVLKGEMSLVGPRPERLCFVEQLAEVIPLFAARVAVKPGLTGWAQVNYPYGASVEDARAKLSYDLYYVKHRTPLFDLLIVLATVRVILFRQGSR